MVILATLSPTAIGSIHVPISPVLRTSGLDYADEKT